jgi:putative zinc finger protein
LNNPRPDLHGCAMGDSQRLHSFLDEELPASQHAALSAHLDQCARCAAALRRLKELDRLVVGVRPHPEALSHAASRALLDRALREAGTRRGGGRGGWLTLAWGFAAGMTLVASGIASQWSQRDTTVRHVGSLSRPAAMAPPGYTGVRSIDVAGNFEHGKLTDGTIDVPHPLPPSADLRGGRTRKGPLLSSPSPSIGGCPLPRSGKSGEGQGVGAGPAPAGLPSELSRPRVSPNKRPEQKSPPAALRRPLSEPRPRRSGRRRYRLAAARLGGDAERANRPPQRRPTTGQPHREKKADDRLARLPVSGNVVLVPPEPYAEVPEGGLPSEQEVASLPEGDPVVAGTLPPEEGPTGWLMTAESPADTGTASWTRSKDPTAGPQPVAAPPPQLLVLVTSEPAPSPLTVTVAPEDAPSYARAVALRQDAAGSLTWTQATASTDRDGTKLALVMLGGDPGQWGEDE